MMLGSVTIGILLLTLQRTKSNWRAYLAESICKLLGGWIIELIELLCYPFSYEFNDVVSC